MTKSKKEYQVFILIIQYLNTCLCPKTTENCSFGAQRN